MYGAKLPVGKVWYQEGILSGNKWTLPAPETTERAKVDDDVTACYCLPHHKTWSRDSSVSFIHRNVFHFTIYLFCSSSKKLRCDESSQMTCAQSYKVPKFSRVCVCVWCRIQIQSVKYNRVFSQNLNLYLSNQEDVWWTLRTYLPKLYLCFLRNQRLGSITSAFKQATCVLTFGEHCPHSPVTNRRH